jgi:hypothetical protein
MNRDRTQPNSSVVEQPMGKKETNTSCEGLEAFVMKAQEFGFSSAELSELRTLYAGECGELLK